MTAHTGQDAQATDVGLDQRLLQAEPSVHDAVDADPRRQAEKGCHRRSAQIEIHEQHVFALVPGEVHPTTTGVAAIYRY